MVPADARRFRVSDPLLAETLREAGAELTDDAPQVEIAAPDDLRGEAPLAIVSIDAAAGGALRLARAAKRLMNSVRVRGQAIGARRAIRRRGYPSTVVIAWDVLQAFRLPWLADAPRSRSLVEYLPQRALVVGARSSRAPTLLEAVAADAGSAAGMSLPLKPPLMRAGVLVMVSADAVLRVAVGPSRREIESQVASLEALHAMAVPASVADRVPRVLGRGKSGLADWSIEQRLRGSQPPLPLSDDLLRESVDFLVDLHSVRGSGSGRTGESCASLAEAVAGLSPVHAGAIRELGHDLDAALADVPRGFAHADFFRGNLLAEGDRLVGVIDWDGAGPDRLPLLGLLHLRLASQYRPEDDEWGRTILNRLLPWADAGGDEIARDYCRRVGFEPDPTRLRALALAFWLDLIALHLRLHPFRLDDRRWIDRNIDLVARALAVEGGI